MTVTVYDPESDPAVWRTRFLNLLDRTPVPTAVSTADGVITGANPALAALWNLTPGRLTGRHLLDLFTPADPRRLSKFESAMRGGRRSRYPFRVCWTAAGSSYEGELTVEPVSDPAGEPPPLLAILRADDPHPAVDGRERAVGPVALTALESRILALVAEGRTTAVVARTVGLSGDGVNYHLARLCRRLDASNRTALVARAYVLGLLSPAAWPPEAE
ncbi:PAS domain-containing protein [Streptomyces roseifaciens]|uniref:PAS domain-containing protein n=1 Tax=Streptomyces roseifaciens TaxID=1488406 RepID=UPI000B0920DB|nr:PAS domain-containing protein [Streptomyces roseifaciens]